MNKIESESAILIYLKGLIYPFTSGTKLLTGALVGMAMFLIIGIPFLIGYAIRCARHIFRGDDKLPAWSEEEGGLLTDGINAIITFLPYGIAIFLITVAVEFLYDKLPFMPHYHFMSMTLDLTVISTIITMPAYILGEIALMTYADTGSIKRSINFSGNYRLLTRSPLEFLKAEIGSFIVIFLISIPILFTVSLLKPFTSNLCLVLIMLIIILGFEYYVTICIRTFIWAKYYRKVTGGSIGNAEQAATMP